MALLEKTKRAGSRKCPQVYRKKPAGEGRSAESLEPSAGLGYQLTKPLTSPPDLWSCLYPQVLPRLRVWPTTVPRNVQAKGLEVISIRVLGGPREGTAPVPTGQQLGTNSVCKGWWWWVPRETAGVPQGARGKGKADGARRAGETLDERELRNAQRRQRPQFLLGTRLEELRLTGN